MTLDQIVIDEDFPDCGKLLDCAGLQSLDQVTDMKGLSFVFEISGKIKL
jgi:hypothetical protein